MNRNGFIAYVRDEDYGRRHRLVLYRELGDGTLEVNREDGTWSRHPILEPGPPDAGILLPEGAWDAIIALVSPKSNQTEITRLVEALEIERRRVDQVLDRTVNRQGTVV